MKNIIVGTAGHIDHGKTALVKALTGIDADRLKEEKQRGITIDIGFADLTLGDVRFGFVDVPGHERFIKNMLAGAHGIDLVVLVVAADESVMPQTREHFDICRLLHVKSGLVALTKSDLVEPELLELARSEVEEFIEGSFLAGAPVIPVSSRTGAGIGELKDRLLELASRVPEKTSSAVTRLPIDRAFSIRGFGTVVTGTLISGELKPADEVEALPRGVRTKIRYVQVHGHEAEVARAGQRTAVNLQGVGLDQVARGTVLAPPGRLRASSLIDARLEMVRDSARPLAQRARVRLHHGTIEVMARVVILGEAEGAVARQIDPGGASLVQLRLEEPMTALAGDRFIIRSYSPQITIGGGVVLDPHPTKHRLRDRIAVERLAQLESAGDVIRLSIFAEMAGVRGINAADISSRTGASVEQFTRDAGQAIRDALLVEVVRSPLSVISARVYQKLSGELLALLEAHHRRDPLSLGVSREEVRERVFGNAPPEVFRAVVNHLSEEGKVVAEKDWLRLAAYRPAMSETEARSKEQLEAAFKSAGLQAGTVDEIASKAGIPVDRARKLCNLLLAENRILRLGDFVFHVDSVEDLKTKVRARKALAPRMDVAVFKEITGGLSRKYAIPLLEYLDRERVTRRVGNEREIL
jgi:selenocysteine-specific elongation factor